MLALRSWLEDYVKINLEDEQLADKLSLSGTLVESIIKQLDENIIVGQIKEINPHPNADRLQVAKVFTGIEDLQIVCGAPNIAVGQKVPLALIGTKLEDFEIKKAEIRGVESFGMMCSEKELGLSGEHAGIKVLPEDYKIGEKLSNYLSKDAIFEIEITPNRGDCLSHLGIARELAAVSDAKLIVPNEIQLESQNKTNLSVAIEAKKLCSQYNAIKISGVKVEPSPKWLADRLISMGAKPINNIVDITNFIMLSWGQPLHAFDTKKIAKNKIIVRVAGEFEKITTLDSLERTLPNESLVIADEEKSIAIAGIMGGKNSEVDEKTADIIIESAEFDAPSVRKTSKILGLSTEASYRFERGIDSGKVLESAKYAAKMILEIAGGKVEQIISEGIKPVENLIAIEHEKINNLLGLKLKNDEIDNILNKLGFEISNNKVKIPLWRHDVAIWQDLAEEVGRIYGYDKIYKMAIKKTSAPKKSSYFTKEEIKESMANENFTETINYIFLSANDLQTAKLNKDELLEIKNPIQQENKFLRNSLVPGLLKNIAKNPSFDPILLFEIGHVFSEKQENINIGICASGKMAKENIKKIVGIFKEKYNLELEIRELTREELIRYKIKKPVVYLAESTITEIIEKQKSDFELKTIGKEIKYRPISKFPPAARDFCFILDSNISNNEIKNNIHNSSENILLVEIFDEFVSQKLGKNKKSVAFHIWMQDMEKAMTQVEVDKISQKIINNIKNDFGGALRS